MPEPVWSQSPYLSALMERHADKMPELAPDAVRKRLNALIGSMDSDRDHDRPPEDALRDAKQEFTLVWSLADLNQLLPLAELGRLQSRFADATIRFALHHAWHSKPIARACFDLDAFPGGVPPGLFVLGLGKLGGDDLNFSSDVDLVAFFDPERVPVRPGQGKADICSRVLKQLTRLLSEPRATGFVWRVDWRLRPEASATSLCMSLGAAEEFYFYRSLPWHRLALIKARVVAGDLDAGKAFLRTLRPYVWPRNLDYRSADELRYLKERINLEHPGLKVARRQELQITGDAAAYNLKLGRGGIREIEFIVNALQLIWGGRKAELQVTNTMRALTGLVNEGLMDPAVGDELTSAYGFLRTSENRLQMLQNVHTQILPIEADTQARLIRLLGFDSWPDFEAALLPHRQTVAREFDAMFVAPGEDAGESFDAPAWVDEIDPVSRQVLEGWDAGFQIYGVPNTMASAMPGLYQRLIAVLDADTGDRAAAISRIDAFFRSLPPGGQYFRMLLEFPDLLDAIAPPLICSPAMTSLLSQSPHIIDRLLEPPADDRLAHFQSAAEAALADSSIEARMEGLRRFINEQLYSLYLDFLEGRVTAKRFTELLTHLAEIALDAGVRTVCEYMQLETSPVAVLGLGKLGMGAMAPLSDLDLIYVVRDPAQLELANRFSSRLQTVMAAPMREGRVYEMDTRLRPSGRSGSPTVTLASFERHHLEQAKTWEHLALVAARFITGDEEAGARATEIRAAALGGERSCQQLVNDAHKMLERVREQKLNRDAGPSWQVKLRRGGMLETDYLINLLLLQSAPAHPELAQLDYSAALRRTAELTGHSELPDIIEFWRALQCWTRLLGLEQDSETALPPRYVKALLADMNAEDADELRTRVDTFARAVLGRLDAFFATSELTGTARIEEWEETAVRWQAEAAQRQA